MTYAVWSPDGTTIVATDQRGLYRQRLGDATSTRILPCEVPCLGIDEPAVSPDGRWIAYTSSWFPAYEAGDVGYAGDPAAATKASGEALVEATVPALAQFFADFAGAQLRVGA